MHTKSKTNTVKSIKDVKWRCRVGTVRYSPKLDHTSARRPARTAPTPAVKTDPANRNSAPELDAPVVAAAEAEVVADPVEAEGTFTVAKADADVAVAITMLAVLPLAEDEAEAEATTRPATAPAPVPVPVADV